jgi:hypothetical protein
MNDTLIRRAAFLQTQAACAIVEAIALLVERTPTWAGRDRHGGEEVRALIDKHGIGHNAALSYLDEVM